MASRTSPARSISLALRLSGALALLAMGALHLQQYLDAGYSALPTIGTLFLLNFVGAVGLGLALLLPLERLPGRVGTTALALLAVTGAAMAASSQRSASPFPSPISHALGARRPCGEKSGFRGAGRLDDSNRRFRL